MNIKFTASMALAIDFAMRLVSGNLYKKEGDQVTPPNWVGFHFFNEIMVVDVAKEKEKASQIRRRIVFYYNEEPICIVTLIGEIQKKSTSAKPAGSYWEIEKIGYYEAYTPSPKNKPRWWKELIIKGE